MPIEPYNTNSIVVHIGQRYNIVVKAKEKSKIGDGNFWIRTTTCYTKSIKPGPGDDWMKTGIVRYDKQSTDNPTDRTSKPWPVSQICDDEPLGNIRPKHKWTVGPSKNSITQGENIAVGFNSNPNLPYVHAGLLWDIKETKSSSKQNFQIQYNDPIFLRLADPKPRPEEVVVYSSENYTANDWVCQLSCCVCPFSSKKRSFVGLCSSDNCCDSLSKLQLSTVFSVVGNSYSYKQLRQLSAALGFKFVGHLGRSAM